MNRRSDRIDVSDHALLRLLERAGGVDVEALRRAIAASVARSVAVAERIGVREFVIVADGYHYVIKDGVVVTIFRDGPR